VVLSVHTEGPYIKRAFEAGAAGYLSKDSAREELINAIKAISAGQRYLSASIAQQLAISLDGDSDGQPKQLTPREFEIMRMLSSGKTVSEVSRELFLSVKTVSTHRTRILQKLNLKTNVELAYYAMKNKLLDE
jgi:two-component system, NarL family, invasion response regulator UvrY